MYGLVGVRMFVYVVCMFAYGCVCLCKFACGCVWLRMVVFVCGAVCVCLIRVWMCMFGSVCA